MEKPAEGKKEHGFLVSYAQGIEDALARGLPADEPFLLNLTRLRGESEETQQERTRQLIRTARMLFIREGVLTRRLFIIGGKDVEAGLVGAGIYPYYADGTAGARVGTAETELEDVVERKANVLNPCIWNLIRPNNPVSPIEMLQSWQSLCYHITRAREEVAELSVWRWCERRRALHILAEVDRWDTAIAQVKWERSLWDAAGQGAEVFADAEFTEDMVLDRPQFWSWDETMALHEDDQVENWGFTKPMHLVGWVVCPSFEVADRSTAELYGKDLSAEKFTGRRGITAIAVTLLPLQITDRDEDGPIEIALTEDAKLPRLRIFPPLMPGEKIGMYWMLAARLRFLADGIAQTEPMSLPRPYRRRLERDRVETPSIHTVILRRNTGRTHAPPASREWQHQWIVRGHWRKQWIGEGKPHVPAYVRPHVKGPEGKPLKTPSKTVYMVKR